MSGNLKTSSETSISSFNILLIVLVLKFNSPTLIMSPLSINAYAIPVIRLLFSSTLVTFSSDNIISFIPSSLRENNSSFCDIPSLFLSIHTFSSL